MCLFFFFEKSRNLAHLCFSSFIFSDKSALDEHDHFMVFHRYEDAVTFKLIGAVCEVLGKETRQYILKMLRNKLEPCCMKGGVASAKNIDLCQSAQFAQADMSRNFLLLVNNYWSIFYKQKINQLVDNRMVFLRRFQHCFSHITAVFHIFMRFMDLTNPRLWL